MSTLRSDEELKHEVYAVLFSVAKRMLAEEIAQVVKEPDVERVKGILSVLRADLDAQHGPVVLMQEGQEFKLQVRTKFLDIVQKVVRKTEMPKSVLETLAVVAYKTPVMQSDIIRIRTNKAYAHLDQLEEKGFVVREPYGRTRLVRVTGKFYEYFELSPEELQKHIAKRQIREEGEQQQKITAMVDEATGLEVYTDGRRDEPKLSVYTDSQDSKSSQPSQGEQEDVDAQERQDHEVSPAQSDESLFIDAENKESPEQEQSEVTEIQDAQPAQKEHDAQSARTEGPSARSAHETVAHHPKDEHDDEADEEEYEPPKVKGGFTSFSSEEKKHIKERSDEIVGDDDEEED